MDKPAEPPGVAGRRGVRPRRFRPTSLAGRASRRARQSWTPPCGVSPSTASRGRLLNDIAQLVGIRRPSLLHHFPPKRLCIVRCSRLPSPTGSHRVAEATDRPQDGWEQVDRVLTSGFRFFAESPEFVRLVRREALEGGGRMARELAVTLRPCWSKPSAS